MILTRLASSCRCHHHGRPILIQKIGSYKNTCTFGRNGNRTKGVVSIRHILHRNYSVTRTVAKASSSSISVDEPMRVAIVGGGAAGLSTALHLSPLVEKGLISSPIDVYEKGIKESSSHNHKTNEQESQYSGSGSIGRDIGVGLWSTALTPFLHGRHAVGENGKKERRQSHQMVWDELTRVGRWVGKVGYRTPKGSWLAKSTLPATGEDPNMPDLLFLREKDMLSVLRQAVQLEEELGTIQIHNDGSSTSSVSGIHPAMSTWSANLRFDNDDGDDGQTSKSDRDYHLIIAAEGMNSNLRKLYGGHRFMKSLTGAAALQNDSQEKQQHDWEETGQMVANTIEDRQYFVYRGNAGMTDKETGVDGISFQTWGTGKSMRFATVPISYPDKEEGSIAEKQVWFITSSDPQIANETDAEKRKEKLMTSFGKWHDPIVRLIEATPAEEILVERALAHKHSMGPVLNVNRILRHIGQTSEATGPGAAIVFVGDAHMTVDPILAQGFTMALEGAYELANSLEECCGANPQPHNEQNRQFCPYELRTQLQERHDRRGHRLIKLLRATELVQALGQPDSKTVSGFLSKRFIRPLMRLSPDFIKRPIFDSMLRYSLDATAEKKK